MNQWVLSILRFSLSVVCLPPGAPPPGVTFFLPSLVLLVLDPQLVVFSFSRDREIDE